MTKPIEVFIPETPTGNADAIIPAQAIEELAAAFRSQLPQVPTLVIEEGEPEETDEDYIVRCMFSQARNVLRDYRRQKLEEEFESSQDITF